MIENAYLVLGLVSGFLLGISLYPLMFRGNLKDEHEG
jgi:hypothetical protein